MGVAFVTRGNIQQINYIPQIEQHSPFGLMLLCLGNVTIMCVCVCVGIELKSIGHSTMGSYTHLSGYHYLVLVLILHHYL